PGGGEPYPTAVADEELLAQFGLEPADLLADGRLRNRDALGRPGEVAVLGYRYEVGQLAKFHKQNLSNLEQACLGLITGWSPSVSRMDLMDAAPQASAHGRRRGSGRRPGMNYALPAVMATAMSLVVSWAETIVRVGLAANLPMAWLSSFVITVVVATPTAILVAPPAQRLARWVSGEAKH